MEMDENLVTVAGALAVAEEIAVPQRLCVEQFDVS
jgi:hypothetical protein